MTDKKIHFVIDKTEKAKQVKNSLLKVYKNYKPNKSNVIVVIGGDGFMLETLKKYQKYNKPFYGINKGTFGFLMNKFKLQNLKKHISKAKLISISPLEAKIKTKKNKSFLAFAINEVSLFRQSRQTSSLKIESGAKILIKKLISDGVLISTPAGSTAYNLSVYGPILSLNSNRLSISPISAFRPRRWKGKIVNHRSAVMIKNLNPKKRPISAVADNHEFRNAKKIIIKTNYKIKFKLLYDNNRSLQKKIKIEQLRRETS